MANVPGMTGGGREASVPTGFKTADLLEDSWLDHVASLCRSSFSLPILPANYLGANTFASTRNLLFSLVFPPSSWRSAHHSFDGVIRGEDALDDGGDEGFRESRRRNEAKGDARYADPYTPPSDKGLP